MYHFSYQILTWHLYCFLNDYFGKTFVNSTPSNLIFQYSFSYFSCHIWNDCRRDRKHTQGRLFILEKKIGISSFRSLFSPPKNELFFFQRNAQNSKNSKGSDERFLLVMRTDISPLLIKPRWCIKLVLHFTKTKFPW